MKEMKQEGWKLKKGEEGDGLAEPFLLRRADHRRWITSKR